MPKMPRIGGSHTFEELEAMALKEAAAQPSEPAENPPAPQAPDDDQPSD